MNARSIGVLLAGTVLCVGATACGGDKQAGSSSAASGGEPLTVALIPPSAGPLAKFGSSAVNAWKLAADEVNAKGGVDGHRVKIVTLETDGTPAATLRSARKAVTQDGAKYVSGIVTSGENAALAPQLAALGAVNIVSMSKDDSLTGSACSPNLFRTTISSGMDVSATSKVLADLPGKRWALLMSDILTGHTAAEQFAAQAKKSGKEIVSTQFDPLGTTEYGSYITKIKSSGADSLYVFASGADGVAFVKQADQFKLFDQVKTVVGFSTFSEPVFPAMGDSIDGFYNNLNYSWNFDNPLNKTFAASYEKKYGEKAWFIPAENYIAAQFLFNAVRKAKTTDVDEVKAAMNGLSFDTISGPFEMRAGDHQAVRDTFVGEIVQDGTDKGWKVVKTVPPTETTPNASGDCRM
jgi:ABC-type branched-subunit amino acid transport system substrate-binding protein